MGRGGGENGKKKVNGRVEDGMHELLGAHNFSLKRLINGFPV